jgi:hypothetical protein
MKKGKILKIRVGHEANCSSGMVPMFMLILGSGGGLLATLAASVAQAMAHHKNASTRRLSKGYLLIPIVLGLLGIAALGLWLYPESYSRADQASIVALGLGIAASYSLTVGGGYLLAPRLRYWLLLVAPLIFILSLFLIASILFDAVWPVVAGFN